MSTTTGVVLCYQETEAKSEILLSQINRWLAERDHRPIALVDNAAGGERPHLGMRVACGGFKNLEDNEFASAVMALTWEFPYNVVLIMDLDGNSTAIYRPWGKVT